MSETKFINIGKNIFNKDHVISITETVESDDKGAEVPCVAVRLTGLEDPLYIKLPEGKSFAEVMDATRLNS